MAMDSPVLLCNTGVFMFPDMMAPAPGYYVGVVLSSELPAADRVLFQDLLSQMTDLRVQVSVADRSATATRFDVLWGTNANGAYTFEYISIKVFLTDQMERKYTLTCIFAVFTSKYIYTRIGSDQRIVTQCLLANPLVPVGGTESYFRQIRL